MRTELKIDLGTINKELTTEATDLDSRKKSGSKLRREFRRYPEGSRKGVTKETERVA